MANVRSIRMSKERLAQEGTDLLAPQAFASVKGSIPDFGLIEGNMVMIQTAAAKVARTHTAKFNGPGF